MKFGYNQKIKCLFSSDLKANRHGTGELILDVSLSDDVKAAIKLHVVKLHVAR